MAQPPLPTFGNVMNPDLAWVAKVKEAALEPELPIVDPHHHLWERPDNDYMLHDLLADTGDGHNVVGTVFVECGSMFRADGPAEMRCVGETEFANGVAAMSASGHYGKTARLRRHCRPCRPAHRRQGRRGIRSADRAPAAAASPASATRPACDDDPAIRAGPHQPDARPDGRQDLARGLRASSASSASPSIPGSTIRRSASSPTWPAPFRTPSSCSTMSAGRWAMPAMPAATTRPSPTWKKSMAELAKRPNVNVKLGGLGMRHGLLQFLRTADAARLARRWPPPSSPGSRPA